MPSRGRTLSSRRHRIILTPTPREQPGDPHEEVEIPGAIFSYPILRQQGEPILDEETPPQPVPHKPVMPTLRWRMRMSRTMRCPRPLRHRASRSPSAAARL